MKCLIPFLFCLTILAGFIAGCNDDPTDPDAGDYADKPFDVWIADASVNAVAVSSSGMVYATGRDGDNKAYVVKYAQDGSKLRVIQLGIGEGYAIAVGSNGEVVVGGATNDPSFPTKNAYQPNYHPGSASNCFVTRLSPGFEILQSSFYGGGSQHAGDSNDGSGAKTIRIDSEGNAWFLASSQDMDFPLGEHGRCFIGKAAGPGYDIYDQPYTYGYNLPPCWSRVIIGKVTQSGAYRGFNIGGYEPDTTSGPLAIGADGSVYLGARCKSGGPLLWATVPGSYRTTIYQQGQTYFDGAVCKLGHSLSDLAYSTFLGGHGQNDMMAGAVDSSGQFVLAGRTKATDFPVTSDAFQRKNNGSYDWTLTRFNSDGTALTFSSYLGGTGTDAPSAMALDSQGRAWVCGYGGGGGFYSGAVLARFDFSIKQIDLYGLTGEDANDIAITPTSVILAMDDAENGEIFKIRQ